MQASHLPPEGHSPHCPVSPQSSSPLGVNSWHPSTATAHDSQWFLPPHGVTQPTQISVYQAHANRQQNVMFDERVGNVPLAGD
jgi:hypothetical protein